MAREISNSEDIIDSRDIIARIEELEADEERDEDENAELANLTALAEEGENSAADWIYGAGLIRHSYFTEYARELADDIGAIDGNAGWPMRHIDWDAAADELAQDYSDIEFDGVTYFVRS